MGVGGEFDDFSPLHLRPHHEGIHGPLDVVRRMFLSLRGIRVRRGGSLIDDQRTEGGAGGEWELRERFLEALWQHPSFGTVQKVQGL